MPQYRRLPQRLALLSLVLLFAALLSACSEGQSLPTEPEPIALTEASTANSPADPELGDVRGQRGVRGVREAAEPGSRLQAAREAQPAGDLTFEEAKGGKGGGKGGNGGNGGNGNGGNGNGGNDGKGGKGSDLAADIQPDVWNTNWEHSEGTVSVVIRGSGLDKIDTSTIVLVGTDAAAGDLAPLRVQSSRTQIRAFFAKSDAIDLLDTPERGETHELKIEFTAGDEAKSLTLRVRVVGPSGDDDGEDDDEEVDLEGQIQPDSWNTNWVGSAGTVSVKITGKGLADVELDSIVLIGTDPAAAPLPALRASRTGNHVRAFFAKSDAFKTLDTPATGERHEIIIRFDVADVQTEIKDTIRVVGP
ncbi:MAG TPA: hypothetical protein VE078_08785 [Thermoanaerobaculia bacterium]|nr:hypothetical protein [Thermoanaerobaculia bacterium]